MQLPPSEFAEVQKFRFDAEVEASDGVAGKLNWVVADPATRVITFVGIKPGLFGMTYDVPVRFVSAADDQTVTLSIALDEIKQYGTRPPGAQLNRSTHVATSNNKHLGRLLQLTINRQTAALRHLVVERLGRESLVNAGFITTVSAKQISVNLGNLQPGQLTPYRSDANLRDEVQQRLFDYARLRPDLSGITIHAIDGAVWLKGHVSSDVNRRMIDDLLEHVTGLSELHNELLADNQLAAAVSYALSYDPRTAGQRIGVYPRLGSVFLRGVVQSPAASTAATEIATKIPGVEGVTNEMRVNPQFTNVPDLAAVTNMEDLVPGGS
ncbi:MAG: BON domain-containing protein [Ktedonobacterales bacterium]